jgi:hypothetical protein
MQSVTEEKDDKGHKVSKVSASSTSIPQTGKGLTKFGKEAAALTQCKGLEQNNNISSEIPKLIK